MKVWRPTRTSKMCELCLNKKRNHPTIFYLIYGRHNLKGTLGTWVEYPMTHSQTTLTDQAEKILKSWGLKKRHLAGRDFWSPWSVDKRRNVPGNISSIRQQCAVCENLIRPALIRADETLSHFSRRLRTTSPPSIDSTCRWKNPTSRQISSFFARPHYFKEFLLYFGTLLLSSFVGATFCLGHVAGRILQGVAKRRVAIWQAVAVAEVAKAQKTTPGIPLN